MSRPAKHRLGLYSSPKQFSKADGRTAEGKFLKTLRGELASHVGGEPSTPQQLIIQSITFKAARLAMISEAFRAGTDANKDKLDDAFLRFSASMREDLKLLGVEKVRQELPSLATYIAERAG